MKKNLMISFSLAIVFASFSCDNPNRVEASEEAQRKMTDSVERDHVEVEKTGNAVYSCPMHPEVIKEQPGICPICKMTLVKTDD